MLALLVSAVDDQSGTPTYACFAQVIGIAGLAVGVGAQLALVVGVEGVARTR